jgi:hypothetical protein
VVLNGFAENEMPTALIANETGPGKHALAKSSRPGSLILARDQVPLKSRDKKRGQTPFGRNGGLSPALVAQKRQNRAQKGHF